nr:MAG TPA: hypothetical protein [Caudoviricetes sp.]
MIQVVCILNKKIVWVAPSGRPLFLCSLLTLRDRCEILHGPECVYMSMVLSSK